MLRRPISLLVLLMGLIAGTAMFMWNQDAMQSRQGEVHGVSPATASDTALPPSAKIADMAEDARNVDTQADDQQEVEDPLVTERHSVRASSFWRLLDLYDASDRDLLQRFDQRYRGALQFGSEEQFRWMAEHGYPLPEDILEARSLTDDELRKLAARGDDKYLFLYADRVFQGLISAKREFLGSGLDLDSIDQYPAFSRHMVEANRIRVQLARAESPFAGYVISQLHWISDGDPFAQLAALHLAAARGDFRAHSVAQATMEQTGVAPEVGAALSAFSALVSESNSGYADVMPFSP